MREIRPRARRQRRIDLDARHFAGAPPPAPARLDGLAEGGRLILPLTTDKGFMHNDPPESIERRGAVFLIDRRGGAFPAEWVSPVAIIPCEGVRASASEAALAAFKKGGWKDVTRLYRRDDLPDPHCEERDSATKQSPAA